MSSTQIFGLQNLPLKLLLLALHVKKFGAPILPDSFKCKISEMKRAHVREGADSGKDCGGLGSLKRHNRGQFVSEGRSSITLTHERKKRVKKMFALSTVEESQFENTDAFKDWNVLLFLSEDDRPAA